MLTIESNKVDIDSSQEVVYNFLMDLNNFEELLPQKSVSKFSSTKSECSFKVSGGYHIGLVYKDSTPFNKINLVSSEGSPFPFTLEINLDKVDEKVIAYQVCNADVNPFLKMMIEKPLKNLFDYINTRVAKKYNEIS